MKTKPLAMNSNMESLTPKADAPFRTGITGKYKLLIKSVTHKFDGYEYELADSDGKEYMARSEKHYAVNQLLRCIISFKIENARFVVSGVSICGKQDFATLLPELKKSKKEKPATIPKKDIYYKTIAHKPQSPVFYDSPADTEKTGTYPLFIQERLMWYGDGLTKYQYLVKDIKDIIYHTISSRTYSPGTEVLCRVEVLKEIKRNIFFVAITGDDTSKPVAYIDNVLMQRQHYYYAPGYKKTIKAKKSPCLPKYKASSCGYNKGDRYLFTATGEKDALGGQIFRGELGGLHLLEKSSVQYEYGDKVRCTVKGFSSFEHDSLIGQYALLSEPRKIASESTSVWYFGHSKTPSQWAREVQGLGKHKCGKPFKCSCCGHQFPMNSGFRIDFKDIYFCNACARDIFEPGKRGNSRFFIPTPMGNKR